MAQSKKRGPKPGPQKVKRLLSLSLGASKWLDEKAVEKGDKTGMAYLARNVERWAAEDK